jgi:hypothetical protein
VVNSTQFSGDLSELGPTITTLTLLLLIAWVIASGRRTRRLVQLIRAVRKRPPSGGTPVTRGRPDRR